jgi:hypothetical protein
VVKVLQIEDPSPSAKATPKGKATASKNPSEAPKEKGAEGDRLLLCMSEARREKEKSIVSKAEERFLNDVHKLASRVEKGQLVDEGKIHSALGRVKAKHPTVNRYYQVSFEKDAAPNANDKT